MNVPRETILAAARSWLGTPYHHQASVKGVGCDCVGLIRGVWRDVIGPEPAKAPPYSRDWGDANGRETMHEYFSRYLNGVRLDAARPGDVVCIRWKPRLVMKHCLILSEDGKMIHAVNGSPVVEVNCSEWWREKFAAAFAFPGVV